MTGGLFPPHPQDATHSQFEFHWSQSSNTDGLLPFFSLFFLATPNVCYLDEDYFFSCQYCGMLCKVAIVKQIYFKYINASKFYKFKVLFFETHDNTLQLKLFQTFLNFQLKQNNKEISPPSNTLPVDSDLPGVSFRLWLVSVVLAVSEQERVYRLLLKRQCDAALLSSHAATCCLRSEMPPRSQTYGASRRNRVSQLTVLCVHSAAQALERCGDQWHHCPSSGPPGWIRSLSHPMATVGFSGLTQTYLKISLCFI